MSNVLRDDKRQQIIALGRLGWSLRRIQKAVGVRRETASSYLREAGIVVRPPGGWGWPSANPAIKVITDAAEELPPVVAAGEPKAAIEVITDSEAEPMPVVMHAVMLPTAAALGTLHWQAWLTKSADGLYHSPPDRGWGALTSAGLSLRIALNAIVGVIVVSALAFFEEIGWRAWLLPRLSDLMTRRKAIVLSSVLWALWHVPYALAGIQHLNRVPLVWTALVVPVGVVGSGLVLGWFWMKTESLWIVAIAHGALNNWGQYAFKFVAGAGQTSDALVLSSGSFALVTLGIILCWTRLRPTA